MFYVKSMTGKITCFDKDEDFKYWSIQPGFTVPGKDEVNRWQNYRTQEFEKRRLMAEDNLKKDQVPVVDNTPQVYFNSVIGGPDGYGVASQNIYRELKELDVKISFRNMGQPIGFLFHAPYSIMRLDSDYKVLYTMFESSKIPADWQEYLKEADKILVPSRWCQKVFKESGVETEVVPLGYDDRLFKPIQRINKRRARKDFVFLHYNAYNIRKGFLEVVKAFVAEFDKDEPVKMIFKTNVKRPPFPFVKEKYPNIEVIEGDFNTHQLVELCYKADCFVFPSRGEGFGITPLEAMATGIPAIMPNAHGLSEFFNEKYCYEVRIEKTCPGIYSRYKGQDVGDMYVSDVGHLRQQMRYVYEHQDEVLTRGQKCAEYARQWTFQNTAKRLQGIFQGIMELPIVKRPQTNILPLEAI